MTTAPATPPQPTPRPEQPDATRPSRSRRVLASLMSLLPHRLLFNPVFWKDAAIAGRKPGTFIFRGFYAAAILAVVLIGAFGISESIAFGGAAEALSAGSLFASVLSQLILWTQFFALMLAGAILASACISHERTSRTLDSLFTTPLSRFQIIAGKFTARYLQIIILALIPLPILLMLRAFGGVETSVTLKQAALILTAAGLTTSLATLSSVYTKRPWAVLTSTTTLVGLVHAIGPTLAFAASQGISIPEPLLIIAFAIPPIYPFIAASIPDSSFFIAQLIGQTTIPFFAYAVASQILLAAAILGIAAKLLRRREIPRARRNTPAPEPAADTPPTDEQPAAAPQSKRSRARRRRRRRRAGESSRTVPNHPIIWREFLQPGLDLGRLQRFAPYVYAVLLLILVVLFCLRVPYDNTRVYQADFGYLITFSALAAILMISAITRTTPLIPQERSARTWDVLRTTLLSPRAIISQKYIGSMLRLWLFSIALTLVLVPAVLLGHIHFAAIPLLAFSLIQFTAFLGATGILCGTYLRKGLAASSANLIIAILLWIVLPIAAEVLTQGDAPGYPLMINPLAQMGTTIAGTMDMVNQAWGTNEPFDWPHDSNLSLTEHIGLLLGSGLSYLLAILAALALAARRLTSPAR